MDWKYFVKLFVFTLIGLLIAKAICGPDCAWADSGADDRSYLAEYAAICDELGREPYLDGVSPEEYIYYSRKWHGHRIVSAVRKYDWVHHSDATPLTESQLEALGLSEETRWLVTDVQTYEPMLVFRDKEGKVYKVTGIG